VLPTEDNPPEMENKPALIELATQIVAAYVTKNPVEQADLPKLITEVHRALEKAAAGPAPGGSATVELKPAVFRMADSCGSAVHDS
jgi:predicted transcriptional regulator